MVKPWTRRERAHVANSLSRRALVEIRYLARHPESTEGIDAALARIAMIADPCHNLPGAGEVLPRSIYDLDPFVYLWQSSTDAQRERLIRQVESLGSDYRYLVEAAPWPPPARAPAAGPRLRRGGWRLPRSLNEFVALDTATLRTLILEAAALEPPGRKRPHHLLAHLDPTGHHLMRAGLPGEVSFLPPGPQDLRQYRGLVAMRDGTVVAAHPRLRASSFAALPPNLNSAQRLRLSASVPQSHERDVYLWTRDHRAAEPQCPLCSVSPRPDTAADEA